MPPSPDPAHSLNRRLLHYARPRQLQLVARMAELGSIQKAAAALGMSQPSATQALANLEALLGVKIFDRHARGIRPSDAGALLLPAILRAVGAIEALGSQAATVLEGARGLVRLAGISAASTSVLAQTLPALCAAHPDLWIDYQEVDADRISQLCTDGGADLLLCRVPTLIPQGHRFVPLAHDQHSAFCAHDHPLTRKRGLALRHCAAQTWILPPKDAPSHAAFMQWCEAENVQPTVARISTRSVSVITAMMRDLKMLYVGPNSHMRTLVETGVVRRLPLTIPGRLDALGLLRKIADAPAAVELVADHLVRWAKAAPA
ncbi:MAG: LysR family transcriptional regulator, partial [Comamonadaceae bacterium]